MRTSRFLTDLLAAILLLAPLLLTYPATAQRVKRDGFPARPNDRVVTQAESRRAGEELAALKVALSKAQPEKAEALMESLLTRYPGRAGVEVAYSQDTHPLAPFHTYEWLADYPEIAYQARAQARLRRADLRGAEADFSRALQYALPRRIAGYLEPSQEAPYAPEPGGGNWGWLPRARRLYEGRAQVRRHLGDETGACADLGCLWQLAPERLGANALFRGCTVTGRRPFALTPSDKDELERAAADSMRRLAAVLADSTPAAPRAALRTANHLAQGRIGP
ncbi:MAG: hypothetical protein H7330_01925, partial [Hymenobacteraceae bacterium]|nr:hypothetical protein [Hymenobacteraceae bacterium]